MQDAGRELWRAYFAVADGWAVRDQFKLKRPDVGWYQIRNALKLRAENGAFVPASFGPVGFLKLKIGNSTKQHGKNGVSA